MSYERWVEVKRQWCDIAQAEAIMLERRVYASEVLPDTEPYRILGRKCSHAVSCNLIGCSCRWAYTEPAVDRFTIQG